jgi:hypothetical protein
MTQKRSQSDTVDFYSLLESRGLAFYGSRLLVE